MCIICVLWVFGPFAVIYPGWVECDHRASLCHRHHHMHCAADSLSVCLETWADFGHQMGPPPHTHTPTPKLPLLHWHGGLVMIMKPLPKTTIITPRGTLHLSSSPFSHPHFLVLRPFSLQLSFLSLFYLCSCMCNMHGEWVQGHRLAQWLDQKASHKQERVIGVGGWL